MSKKARLRQGSGTRTRTEEPGTVYERGEPTRWRSVSPWASHGHLRIGEQLSILAAPYPDKKSTQLDEEAACRRERVDRNSAPDFLPLKTITLRRGLPELSEPMLRMLCGERPLTEDERLFRDLLVEYERKHPACYHVLAHHYLDGWSFRKIEEETTIHRSKVKAMVALYTLQIIEEFHLRFGRYPNRT